jgi:hypothetical protein
MEKIIKKIISLYYYVTLSIKYMPYFIFYKTPWFIAMSVIAWEKYRNSKIYTYRFSATGHNDIFAAVQYKYSEHLYFIKKVCKDKQIMKQVLLHPYKIINKHSEDDYSNYLKRFVKF